MRYTFIEFLIILKLFLKTSLITFEGKIMNLELEMDLRSYIFMKHV